ncbi:MAG: caspase family protein [Pseudomonadota bacterium]
MRSFIFAAAILAASALPAAAEKRVALVIGNSAYQNVARLDNPKNDAKLIADALKSVGFSLVGGGAQLDLDKPKFDFAVQEFGKQLLQADVALFYYAGHGVQVRGSNYLVPISANPTREADVDFQMLDANLVLRQMESSGAKLNLMILDACRNNPFGGRGLRAGDGGLAQMKAPEGTIISYATQPGNVAQDGTDGNSPYTKALAATIKKPGLDVFKTFNEVGVEVSQRTASAQQPWLATSPIKGDFYFVGGGQTAASKNADLEALQAKLKAAEDALKEAAERSKVSEAKAKAALEEQTRLAIEGAKKAEQDRAAAEAKRAEEQRIAAALAKTAEDAKVAEAAKAKAAADAKAAEDKARADEAARVAAEKKAAEDTVKAGQKIAALAPPAEQAPPKADAAVGLPSISSQLLVELKRVGCNTGEIDGSWNAAARKSVDLFNKNAGTNLDLREATLYSLWVVQAKRSQVCPLGKKPALPIVKR